MAGANFGVATFMTVFPPAVPLPMLAAAFISLNVAGGVYNTIAAFHDSSREVASRDVSPKAAHPMAEKMSISTYKPNP